MVTKSRLEGIEFKYQADEDTFRELQDSYESNLAKYALTISSGEKFALQLLLRIKEQNSLPQLPTELLGKSNHLTEVQILLTKLFDFSKRIHGPDHRQTMSIEWLLTKVDEMKTPCQDILRYQGNLGQCLM